MSDFTKVFNLTIPAGNGVQTLTTFATPLGLCVVQRIIVVFPPGCVNLVGLQITSGKSPVYPVNPNAFLQFDDYIYTQEVSNQVNSGQWGAIGFNTDFNAHTLEVVFEANYVTFSPDLTALSPLAM